MWIVLILFGFQNMVEAISINLNQLPDFFRLLLSLGTTDIASRIMLSLFVIFVLSVIHLEPSGEHEIIDSFLRKHLPSILWGVGLACIFGMFSITLSILFIYCGYLLHKEPDYGI